MSLNIELLISLTELKKTSIMLTHLANSLESNRLDFSFEISSGETADKAMELVNKYNELGSALAQLVRELKGSVDETREGFKQMDELLAAAMQKAVSAAPADGGIK